MSQARVTDYFATRKRNRLLNGKDETAASKQKRTTLECSSAATVLPEAELISAVKRELAARATRSTAARQIQAAVDEQTAPQHQENKEQDEDAPRELAPRLTRAARNKQHGDELKQRVKRLDDKIAATLKPALTQHQAQEGVNEQPVAAEPDTPALVEAAPVAVEIAVVSEAKPKRTVKAKKKVDMAELKAKIQGFNERLRLVQEAEPETKQVESVCSVPNESAEVTVTPSQLPAYVKHRDLASADIELSQTLTLPALYARLFEAFKSSDTIVKLLFNRQEVCTFLKLRMGIQNITKRNFLLKHLAQIKTVYPGAYELKQEKMFVDFKNDYHLTVTPNLEELEKNAETGLTEFSPSALLNRVNKFKSSLFKMVKNFHQKFLQSLGLAELDDKDIKRWHPKFDLESVADIEEAELPKSPNDAIKVKTGKDLVNMAKEVYSSRIKAAIDDYAASMKDSPKLEVPVVKQSPAECLVASSSNIVPNKAAGDVDSQVLSDLKEKKAKNYSALLEKIRNKEKTKAIESMIINSDKEKKLVRFGFYKEAVRFLLSFFQSEKKSVLDFDRVCAKLSECLNKQLGELECGELLREMAALDTLNAGAAENSSSKKFIAFVRVRNLTYVQLDRAFSLNELWAKCEQLVQNLN